MDIKRLISILIVLLTLPTFHAVAGNVTAREARATANGFIKSHYNAKPGMLKVPAMSDLVLAYAEPSDKVAHANCYYIFNIKGGGFVIVSGEDHATPVLGYSDKGQIDVVNMPDPLKGLLGGYKEDIEYLLTHDIKVPTSFIQSFRDAVDIVPPMIKSSWGQLEPYYNMCPMLNGNHSKVGCAAVCMAQLLYFWQFPISCDSIPSYYAARLSGYVPALPPTEFDYNKMLPTYAQWDIEHQRLVQGVYTEEQAEEVAKLCRYSGQALKMNYSPSSSANQVYRIVAMKAFGYNSKAISLYRNDYNDSIWVELLKAELDAGRPIGYSGKDPVRGSAHAFILDGYNSEDYFHINLGWFGISDGWYQISAMILTYLDGSSRHYKSNNSFTQGLEPPLFCIIDAEVGTSSGLHFLGETLTAQASNVYLSMSYRTLPFMFSLTDAEGNEVTLSESITLNRLTFENGTDISLALTLPETLLDGIYDLHLNYRTGDSSPLTQAVTADGQLYVLGKFAKFGAPFSIADVTDVIDMILYGNSSGVQVNIADVTMLIDNLLN